MFADTGEESIKFADKACFFFFHNVTGTVTRKKITKLSYFHVGFTPNTCLKLQDPTCPDHFTHRIQSQPEFTCPKLTIGTLEQGVQYVQS